MLNRARAAVEAPHSSRPWSFGWLHALTTAAVIVLAIALVMPLRETGQPGGAPETPPRPPAAEEAASTLSEESAEEVEEPMEPDPARARQDASRRALADPALEKAAAAPAAVSEDAGADARTDAVEDAELVPDQETRLRAIEDLVEAGDLEAAREALVAFRRDFPEAELPPELAALLEPP